MVAFNDPSRIVVNRIRREIDIVEVVREFLDVVERGRIFVGMCPWHEDSRPTLQFNPQRNTWKCWVCDVGGDSIAFLMAYRDLDFRAAVESLAERLADDAR